MVGYRASFPFKAGAAVFFAAFTLLARPAGAFDVTGPCTSNVTCSPNWHLTPSNSNVQHPEIVPIFWQDTGPQQWTNGNGGGGNPTMTQLIGTSLALLNSPYYGALFGYGTDGGGMIARPRMSATAPLFTGVPVYAPYNSRASSFSQIAIEDLITQEINAGAVPPPQNNNDLTVYVVFVPASSTSPETLSTDTCYQSYGCNWGCNYNSTEFACAYVTANSGSGGGAATFGHETIEAISGHEGINVVGCNYTSNGHTASQISDICCNTENWGNDNPYSVGAYWSSRDVGCVIPESWGPLYSNANNGQGWSAAAGDFDIRQAYGGAGGVVATGTDDYVYFYQSNTNAWRGTQFGNAWVPIPIASNSVAELAAGGNNVAAILMDASSVWYYDLTGDVWTNLGEPTSNPPGVTSVSIVNNGWIVVTDTTGSPWYWNWNGNPAHWVPFGGPGDQFTAMGSDILGLSVNHMNVFRWPNANFTYGGNWSDYVYGLGFMSGITATPDAPTGFYGTYGITFPGSKELFSSSSLQYTNGFFEYSVSGAGGNATDVALDANMDTYSCTGSYCQTNDWSHTWGVGGRTISGGEMFVTGCYGETPPCVRYTAVPPL